MQALHPPKPTEGEEQNFRKTVDKFTCMNYIMIRTDRRQEASGWIDMWKQMRFYRFLPRTIWN